MKTQDWKKEHASYISQCFVPLQNYDRAESPSCNLPPLFSSHYKSTITIIQTHQPTYHQTEQKEIEEAHTSASDDIEHDLSNISEH